MKIFMTGGTGFVGGILTRAFLQEGHLVTVLTRRTPGGPPQDPRLSYLQGDPTEEGGWQNRVADHDGFVNLAGTSIFGRWTKKRKDSIRTSRILTTRNLVDAISRGGGDRERSLFSTSAVGYYGFRGDETLDEGSSSGDGFLAELSRDWESEAMRAEAFGVKVVICRFGIVLGRGGGALEQMAGPFRWYLGAQLGSGRQWFSWIHEKDLAEIYLHLLRPGALQGPVNCTSPYPVRNEEMTRAMAAALKRPVLLPRVPAFLLKTSLGEFATALVEGQRVLPRRVVDSGFRFRFPRIDDALKGLLSPRSGVART